MEAAFACQNYVQVPKNSTDTAQRGHRPGEAASSGGRQAAASAPLTQGQRRPNRVRTSQRVPEYTGDNPGAALSLRHRGPSSGPRGGLLHLPISHSRECAPRVQTLFPWAMRWSLWVLEFPVQTCLGCFPRNIFMKLRAGAAASVSPRRPEGWLFSGCVHRKCTCGCERDTQLPPGRTDWRRAGEGGPQALSAVRLQVFMKVYLLRLED